MTMSNYSSVTLYVLYGFNKSQDKVKAVSEKTNILTPKNREKYFVLGRLGNIN